MTRIVFAIVPLAVIAIGIIVVVQFNGASSETSGAVEPTPPNYDTRGGQEMRPRWD
ncbi:MAG: hypothetical protein M9939_26765 [Mesorhizobium sp.]|nr:hypothetical protein [Mesorhizobium sp.]MCO5164697.1 hypothetical protein [Mesorhizobium sp.]